ncbi:MAG: hypothetical protein J0M24_10685 [Verrucomicrobia bacterium]|nr:hypothetical protein [Verrucomicrobiota bacterium]
MPPNRKTKRVPGPTPGRKAAPKITAPTEGSFPRKAEETRTDGTKTTVSDDGIFIRTKTQVPRSTGPLETELRRIRALSAEQREAERNDRIATYGTPELCYSHWTHPGDNTAQLLNKIRFNLDIIAQHLATLKSADHRKLLLGDVASLESQISEVEAAIESKTRPEFIGAWCFSIGADYTKLEVAAKLGELVVAKRNSDEGPRRPRGQSNPHLLRLKDNFPKWRKLSPSQAIRAIQSILQGSDRVAFRDASEAFRKAFTRAKKMK